MKRNMRRQLRRATARMRVRGQSTVEYVIVTSFAVLVLITGEDTPPVQMVITAVKNAYRGFTYALSFSTNLNLF